MTSLSVTTWLGLRLSEHQHLRSHKHAYLSRIWICKIFRASFIRHLHVGREGAPSGAAHAGGPDAAAPQLSLRIDADGNYEHNLGHATHSERKERTWGRLTRRISLGVEDFAKNVRRGGELQVGTLARGGAEG